MPRTRDADEARQLDRLRADLVLHLDAGQTAAVERRLAEVLTTFDGATVRTYVPLLVRKRLRTEQRSDALRSGAGPGPSSSARAVSLSTLAP